MVSIPRDSYVPIPGYGTDKINAAFALGGPPLLAQTVEQATGLRLDHYAEIGFGGFAARRRRTRRSHDVPGRTRSAIRWPASTCRPAARHWTAATRSVIVRSRATPRADLDRMVNQREFMSALLHRAASPGGLAQPVALVLGAAAAAEQP